MAQDRKPSANARCNCSSSGGLVQWLEGLAAGSHSLRRLDHPFVQQLR